MLSRSTKNTLLIEYSGTGFSNSARECTWCDPSESCTIATCADIHAEFEGYKKPSDYQLSTSFWYYIMKLVLVLIPCLTFVLGGVPKDRFNPCIFIDCNKYTTTQPTTKAATFFSNTGKSPKSQELLKIKSKLVRANMTFLAFQEYFLFYLLEWTWCKDVWVCQERCFPWGEG